MGDGFLGRWSRRKEAAREGKPVEDVLVPAPVEDAGRAAGAANAAGSRAGALAAGNAPAASATVAGSTASTASTAPHAPAAPDATTPPQRPAPPTLADTETLTSDSDFSRFVTADVPADVKNAAMKKLFADPHFNVMDRLDTYIDDYNTPDPLPPAMLRQLASAKFLKLFDDEEKKEEPAPGGGREVADDPAAQTVAQSGTDAPAVPPPEAHADTDLRLQQDHASGPQGPGPRTR